MIRTTRRQLLRLLGLGSGCALLAACGPAAPAAPAAVKDASFIVVDGTEPNSLDPPAGTGPFQHALDAFYDNLVSWNAQMEAQPALATSWEPSTDGTACTFHLRPNVKFHDGTPFTSQAVKTTIEHLLDKDTLSTRRANYTLIKQIDTPDDLTVKFTTD